MGDPVLGLATEYVFFFSTQVGMPSRVHRALSQILNRRLIEDHRAVDSVQHPGGLFLVNSGYLRHGNSGDSLQGNLLKMATPECRNARDIVVYHRAQENLLSRILPEIQAEIELNGRRGELIVSKPSSDYRGYCFGSHEFYDVQDHIQPARRIVLASLIALYTLSTLPLVVIRAALKISGILAQPVARLWTWVHRRRVIRDELLSAAESGEPDGVPDNPDGAANPITRCRDGILRFEREALKPLLARASSHLIFDRIHSPLSTFLTTRVPFCGTGWIETSAQGRPFGFVLSGLSSSIDSIAGLRATDSLVPMIDLSDLFEFPRSLLSRKKRLHIAFSDSNMSEYNLWLKLGTTQLFLRALNDGMETCDIELDDPLEALADVSHDLSFRAPLRLKSGSTMTAIEIQQEFMRRVKNSIEASDKELSSEEKEILIEWEETLDCLLSSPPALEDRLDWVAKKALIDEVAGQEGLELARRVAPIMHWLERENVGIGRVAESPKQVEGFFRQRLKPIEFSQLTTHLNRAQLDWEDLPRAYKVYYQLKKTDLKYHSCQPGGYFQQLESEGLFRRVSGTEEIARAAERPPMGTRAQARGRCVQEAGDRGLQVRVGWDRVLIPAMHRVIYFPEPGIEDIPGQAEIWDMESDIVFSITNVLRYISCLIDSV